MTCLQPSCRSQRSVSGFTSARFSDSFGAHGPGFGPSAACAAVAERAAVRTKPRRVTCVVISPPSRANRGGLRGSPQPGGDNRGASSVPDLPPLYAGRDQTPRLGDPDVSAPLPPPGETTGQGTPP